MWGTCSSCAPEHRGFNPFLFFTFLVFLNFYRLPVFMFGFLQVSGFDFKPYVHPIYNAIMSRLTNQDQDQEVKECAISCMGLVVSTFGDHLTADLPACLPVLVDRMGNEITRLTAVKVCLDAFIKVFLLKC